MKTKIFLNATKRSIMDITSNLFYHEEKINPSGRVTEEIYKGNLIFSITEKGQDGKVAWENGRKKYLSTFMTKETAKMVFDSIANDRFLERFGDGGIKYNGGFDTHSNGQLRVKTTKLVPVLHTEKNQLTHYAFLIEEGNGKREQNVVVMDGPSDVSAKHWIPYTEALKMALEVLDYIRAEEVKAMIQGKPLSTIMYGKEGKDSAVSSTKESTSKKQKQETLAPNEPTATSSLPNEEQRMRELSHTELQKLLVQHEHAENEHMKEIYKQALREAKRRMGKAL